MRMSLWTWGILAGLTGIALGLVFRDNLYVYKETTWGYPSIQASTPEGFAQWRAYLRTQPKPVVKVFLLGIKLYQKLEYGIEENEKTYEEWGYDFGPNAKYVLSPLVLGTVLVLFVGLIALYRKIDSLPDRIINEVENRKTSES